MSTSTGKRVGRPRNLPRPHVHASYEAKEFVDRLDFILRALEIDDIDDDARLYLQRQLHRHDLLRSWGVKLATGDGHVTLLLRTINESSNGTPALVRPILEAVSLCMEPIWIDKGLRFIEAFDEIRLVEIHTLLRDLGIEDQFERVLRKKLCVILGEPIAPTVPKKPVRRPAKRARTRAPILQAAA